MKKILSVFISASLAASLALTGAGCTNSFTGEVPAPSETTRFVALQGIALPDTPAEEEPRLEAPPAIVKQYDEAALRAKSNPQEKTIPEPSSPTSPSASSASDSSAPTVVAEDVPMASYAPAPTPGYSSTAVNPEPFIDYSLDPLFNTEEYSALDEHGFLSVATNPLSTFSADVDTASYANLRRMANDGVRLKDIPTGAVRIEEMLNYFDYGFITPSEDEPFSMNAQIADCPWNPDTRLMVLGIQAQQPLESAQQGSNLVFLIDTSGSMSDKDKLPLLKDSFSLLTAQLTKADTISIVTYAGNVSLVLDGARGDETERILGALDELQAGGSTNGASGLALAYIVAQEHFIEGGNNRIIMASDGDLNVGISSESDLHDYVSYKRQTGIYLSVLGFGTGNYKDNKMETLADNGNGNYHYIDSMNEAHKVFVEDLTANMITVADDVKLQVEFNPAYIKGYRQIGYENRELSNADFTDDTKDAAEMGAGHQVIVVYEIVMKDSPLKIAGGDLAYQGEQNDVENGEWLTLALRYKDPGAPVSKGISYTLDESAYTDEPDADWVFVSGVVEFGLVVKDSDNKGTSTVDEALLRAKMGASDDEKRGEFVELLKSLD
jgi:Ca-activated chloride channel family protein